MSMQFVPMTTINKKTSWRETSCSDWVATEKIHGSSFQFFTNDGEKVDLASRRTLLDLNGTFLKCSMKEFHQRHLEFVKLMFQTVKAEDRWQQYRTKTGMVTNDDEEFEDEADADQTENPESDGISVCDIHTDKKDVSDTNTDKKDVSHTNTDKKDVSDTNTDKKDVSHTNTGETRDDPQQTDTENEESESLELRVYGELYGGGGIKKGLRSAVQKEIIYADEFRFYVFGININRKWVTVTEMNDLCQLAGFPYYASPLCPPKPTLEELTQFLTSSGIMNSKSRLTDKTDHDQTIIEGVVMAPLTRSDFGFHAIKLLSLAFNDVTTSGAGSSQKVSYCTKARYHSLLSKLDLPEREDADLVVDMFIADIIKEGGQGELNKQKKAAWTKCVRTWLAADGYIKAVDNGQRTDANTDRRDKGKQGNSTDDGVQRKVEQAEDDNGDEGNDFGGLFG